MEIDSVALLKNKSSSLLLAFILLLQSGCSSFRKSVGLGTAVGAGTGAVIGGILDKDGKYRTRNIIVGAGLGATAGGFLGASAFEGNEKDKELAFLKGKEAERKSTKGQATPELQQPRVEAVWIESKVVGNRYIEGHFEYVIVEPTRWESP
jgi:hypothetical protein